MVRIFLPDQQFLLIEANLQQKLVFNIVVNKFISVGDHISVNVKPIFTGGKQFLHISARI